MTVLFLLAFAFFTLFLYEAISLHEEHSWQRKRFSGDRAKLLAEQKEEWRLFAKIFFLAPVKVVDLVSGFVKDAFFEFLGFDMSCATPGIFRASCYEMRRIRR